MKTITYDETIYKLVPVKALRTAYNLGQVFWQQADSEYESQLKKAGETGKKFLELDATPDTLPGVVEHSGEPTAYLSTDVLLWNRCRIKKQGSFTVPVFKHPAPQQQILNSIMTKLESVLTTRDTAIAAFIDHKLDELNLFLTSEQREALYKVAEQFQESKCGEGFTQSILKSGHGEKPVAYRSQWTAEGGKVVYNYHDADDVGDHSTSFTPLFK